MNKYGIIYKITNTINNKIYIGQTIKEPKIRIRAHFNKPKSKDLVFNASLKYGKEHFKWEVIASAFSKNDLNELEIFFIKYYNSLVPYGYNIKSGGNSGGSLSEESKKLLSEKIKFYYENNEHPFKGKTFSKEHCENLSKARKGFTSERRKEAHKKTIEKLKIPIIAENIKTGQILKYSSIVDCSNDLKLNHSNISRVLNKKQNRTQHKDWIFRYEHSLREEHLLYIEKQKEWSKNNRYQKILKTTNKKKIPIIAKNNETNEILEFNSIIDCSRKLNLLAPCIRRVLNPNDTSKQHRGWTFEYKNKT